MTAQDGASEAAYWRLVERLFLRPPHRLWGGEPELLVGVLPPGWDLPLPDGVVVVGSHREPGLVDHAVVVLDAPGDPEQVVGEVERLLTALGWRVEGGGDRGTGGFMPFASTPVVARALCDDRQERNLHVTGAEGEGGMTDLRLTIDFTPCEPEEWTHRPPWEPWDVFPALSPPPDMAALPGGGGGGGGSGGHATANTKATLRGMLSPEAIEVHYRAQLITAGWQVVESGASGRLAWSIWEFLDEHRNQWNALLTSMAPPGQDDRREVDLQAFTLRRASQPG